jgi:CheY-like chemotaxis protein
MRGTIYVVDDSDEFRTGLTDALEHAGFEVWQAADGHEALERLREGRRRPHLMLVDLMMPRMGAADLLRALRTMPSLDVPVVVMTGLDPRGVAADLKVATVGKTELHGLLPAIERAVSRRADPGRAKPPFFRRGRRLRRRSTY